MTVASQLSEVKHNIERYTAEFARVKGAVSLLAASKGQSLDKIKSAIAAGQLAFGENYLQEALPKIMALSSSNLEWHFIGQLQSNKAKKIAEHFDWVHSVKDKKCADKLNTHRPTSAPLLNICLEINVSQSHSKAGLDFDSAIEMANFCRTLPHLKLRGLMAIPEPKNHFFEQRAECYKLRLLFDLLNSQGFELDTLSMGMSQDMRAAIAEGATIVRIGTALFGERT